MHKRDLFVKFIEKEKKLFIDQSSKRIIIGGMSAGGIICLSAFTKYGSH